ncbi:MAG: hypothetical protein VZR00_03575 [Lachnospiraceae bacterium]|nr:hypothetical protein [Lachnospiraceae bacterium]MEE3460959.1 hypothetical protein [Lachnospiraceae bacterium]
MDGMPEYIEQTEKILNWLRGKSRSELKKSLEM